MGYCTGNIIGPQLFFADQSPSYTSGFLAMLICYAVGILTCIGLRYYLIWENRRRDRVNAVLNEPQNGEMLNLLDKTDKEIGQFRYIY
jgi:hypothetical protein